MFDRGGVWYRLRAFLKYPTPLVPLVLVFNQGKPR